MDDLELAIQAARVAGDYLRQRFDTPLQVRHKSSIEFVTEVDGETEQLIAGILNQARPDYYFLGEESGNHGVPDNAACWVVDPLDGTTNFIHRIPVFAVSIGLVVKKEPIIGVVYQPMFDELFAAKRGEGATMNGQPIRVSKTHKINEALLGAGFPYNAWESPRDNVLQWGRAVKQSAGVLCNGVAALGICDVAMGRLDGYWELKLFPWDIAAGAVIVNEAGGKVTTASGKPFNPFGTSIVADNGLIHDELIGLINS